MSLSKSRLIDLFSQSLGIDKRTLGFFRIALALVLLHDLTSRAGDIMAFYSDAGVLPRVAYLQLYSRFPYWLSLNMLSGQTSVQVFLFAIAFLAAIALFLGYRTRWATLVSWVLLVSLHNRNPMILQGGDVFLRMLLFWSLFLPLGMRFSIDSLRPRSQSDSEPEQSLSPTSPRVFSIATAATLLQVCFVYWFSAALKTGASWTTDGTAIYYALNIDQLVTPVGRSLLAYPELMRQMTFLTLALERFGPFLALLPIWRLRTATLCAFIGFHIALGLCLTLGNFSPVSAVAWLLFIPSQVWNRFGSFLALLRLGKIRSFNKSVLISDSRPSIFLDNIAGKIEAILAPEQSDSPKKRKDQTIQIVAALSLLYIFNWNLLSLGVGFPIPAKLQIANQITRIDQRWGMFAPFPRADDGWLILKARLSDGNEVNLLTKNKRLTWEKPTNLSATFQNEQWQRYLMNMWHRSNSAHRSLYINYLHREWNRSHGQSEQIKSIELIYMREDTLPNGVLPPRKFVLWRIHY